MTLQIFAIAGGYSIAIETLNPDGEIVNAETVAAALPGATLDGNDYLNLSNGVASTAELGSGNDKAVGDARVGNQFDMGSGNDILDLFVRDPSGSTQTLIVHLGEGNDVGTFRTDKDLVAHHVFSLVYGDAGDDKINGSPLDGDVIFGGDGRDTLLLYDTLSDYRGEGTNAIKFDLVSNRAYGDGGDDLIIGGNGFDILRGGLGNDVIKGGSNHVRPPPRDLGDDFGPHPGDFLRGDQGNDTVYGEYGHDRLYGDEGNDVLFGGVGADRVFGGRGNDKIYGGVGKDILFGGIGRDIFVFNASPRDSNSDEIRDFSHDDTIWLDNGYLKAVGKTGRLASDAFHRGKGAADAEDRIIYDRATGALYYDKDGVGGAAQVKIATFWNHDFLSLNDLVVI